MKAITLWPEWVWAIFHLGKGVENRTWAPPRKLMGQRIALHAGAHVGGRPGRVATEAGLRGVGFMATHEGLGWMLRDKMDYMLFTFVSHNSRGIVSGELCMDLGREDRDLPPGNRPLIRKAIVGTAVLKKVEIGDRVPWGVPGMYHWYLSDLLAFPNPISARGKQRFWALSDVQKNEVDLQHDMLLPKLGREMDLHNSQK